MTQETPASVLGADAPEPATIVGDSARRCSRCGERWTDHGGIEEPICHDSRDALRWVIEHKSGAAIKAMEEARICLNAAARLAMNIDHGEAWVERFRAAEQGIEAAFYAHHEGVVPKIGWPGWWVAVHEGKVVGESNDLATAHRIFWRSPPLYGTDAAPPNCGSLADGAR